VPRYGIDLTKPVLGLALDQRSPDGNLRLAEKVVGEVDMLKLNADAADSVGWSSLLEPYRQFELPIFLDIKMLQGKGTMAERAKLAASLGVDFINASAMQDFLLTGPVQALVGTDTRLLGLTIPTHFGEAYCREYFGRSLNETVSFLARKAVGFGCHGIILPATSLLAVADLDTIKVTPAIRPDWSERAANDQEETATPTEAVLGGSNILIVGSPIRKYHDGPVEGARRIREEMLEAFARRVV
jgi:orotidine-5'-phosphate decarboxylase